MNISSCIEWHSVFLSLLMLSLTKHGKQTLSCAACRPELWFWNSVVLFLTLALAASQVFAMALDAYFQLAIMLMIMTIGVTAFAHFRPFVDDLLQRMQVCLYYNVSLHDMSLQLHLCLYESCMCDLSETCCYSVYVQKLEQRCLRQLDLAAPSKTSLPIEYESHVLLCECPISSRSDIQCVLFNQLCMFWIC